MIRAVLFASATVTSVRSLIFEIEPNLTLPPAECYLGVSPSQAAKSRPLAKPSTGGARASSAVAVIGPMPGMVIILADQRWANMVLKVGNDRQLAAVERCIANPGEAAVNRDLQADKIASRACYHSARGLDLYGFPVSPAVALRPLA